MFKKALITLALMVTTTLCGCVVYGPPRPAYYYGPRVAVYGPDVVVPVFGFYGGYGFHGEHWRGGGRWR